MLKFSKGRCLLCHLDVLDDNLGEKPDILIPDSSAEMRLGKLVSHLGHHQLKWALA